MKKYGNVVHNLLSQSDDKAFIYDVYKFLLDRFPDSSGYNHYYSLLDRGISKEKIILDITRSQEFLRSGRKVPGLSYLKLKYFLYRLIPFGSIGIYVSDKEMIRRLYNKQVILGDVIDRQNALIMEMGASISKLNRSIVDLNNQLMHYQSTHQQELKRKMDVKPIGIPKTYHNYDCYALKNIVENVKTRGLK